MFCFAQTQLITRLLMFVKVLQAMFARHAGKGEEA